jgi:hypothetical protein
MRRFDDNEWMAAKLVGLFGLILLWSGSISW